MSRQPEQPPHHHVRRVVLPSGREIEVVYFDAVQPAAEAPAAPAPERVERALHVCPSCSAELVYPVDWEEASATHWVVSLRCPSCAWETVGEFSQDEVDALDEELDRGTESVVRDLQRLTRANMEDELERFIAALEADALLPEDF